MLAGAYYVIGYAVECALKACAAQPFRRDEVPEKKLVNDFYTHQLDRLLETSGNRPAMAARAAAEPDFELNWSTIRDWNEAARYDPTTTEAKARAMFAAVTDANAGVLPWLKTMW